MTSSVASEHEWVGVDACEAVMDAIFRKMCCNNTDYDYADARALESRALCPRLERRRVDIISGSMPKQTAASKRSDLAQETI